MFDEKEDLERSNEIKRRLFGQPYLWKDVWYCLVNNEDTFPPSLSILCRIKCQSFDAGVVYVTNYERRTYKEVYYDDVEKLDKVYKISKQKILMRPKLSIGWEGMMLNNARYS